jgi:hypothetical protein
MLEGVLHVLKPQMIVKYVLIFVILHELSLEDNDYNIYFDDVFILL